MLHAKDSKAIHPDDDCAVKYEEEALHSGVLEGYWSAQFRHLIPIGHDPDTETRTTDREVTA